MDTLNISSLASYASSIASDAATEELKNKAKTAQNDDELMKACKEFESYLWEQVISSMKDTVNIFGEEDSSNSQLVDYFMDSAISDVASQMTEKTYGTNSLASQMYEQMKRNSAIDIEALLAQAAAEEGAITTNTSEE